MELLKEENASRASHAVAAVEAPVAGAAAHGQGATEIAGGRVALEVRELLLLVLQAFKRRRHRTLEDDLGVLELNGGETAKIGLKRGDKVLYPGLPK